MSEDNIKKQLEVKNKEIYLNKLNLDFNHNLEVLILTLDNLIDNANRDLILKVLGMAETFQKESEIKKYVDVFLKDYQEYLMLLLNLKKEKINKIIKDTEIDEYKNILNDYNHILMKKLEKYSTDKITSLKDNLKTLYDDKLYQKRIKKFLNNIFLDNLNNKVFDIIKSRDIVLCNTFKESYLKYLQLNKNTIGIE